MRVLEQMFRLRYGRAGGGSDTSFRHLAGRICFFGSNDHLPKSHKLLTRHRLENTYMCKHTCISRLVPVSFWSRKLPSKWDSGTRSHLVSGPLNLLRCFTNDKHESPFFPSFPLLVLSLLRQNCLSPESRASPFLPHALVRFFWCLVFAAAVHRSSEWM